MDYVNWTIFVWAIGIILLVFGIFWNYINTKTKDLQDNISEQEKAHEELKLKVATLEACYNGVQIVMARIEEKMNAVDNTLKEIKETINKWK